MKQKYLYCEICGKKIGFEESGTCKNYDRPGRSYYHNTIMNKDAHSQEICEDCYQKTKCGGGAE